MNPDEIPPQHRQTLEMWNDVAKILDQAKQGDTSTIPILKKFLEDPATVGLLGGNLAEQAERSLVSAAAGDNLAFREALLRKLQLLRAELAGSNPTPLERLLVDRVVACWLQVQDADIRCAQANTADVKWGEFHQRRMNHANKRYLAAIKTLATVRKLALPAIQVNIARKQTNQINLASAEAT